MIRKIDNFDAATYKGKCFVANLPLTREDNFGIRLGQLDRGGYVDLSERTAIEVGSLAGCKPPEWVQWSADQQQLERGELLCHIKDLEMDNEILAEEERTILGLANELALVSALKDDAIAQFQELEAAGKQDKSK